MKANTAFGLILCSAALIAITEKRPAPVLHILIATATLIAIALGCLTLLEYFCGWSLGIDQWLITDKSNPTAIDMPGRMTPTTACSFLLCGATLTFVQAEHFWPRRALVTAMALASVIATIGTAALLGRVVEALARIQLWNYSGISALTAAAFLLLGVGFLATLSDRSGFRWCLDPLISAGFVLSVLIVLTLAGFCRNSIREMQDAAAWVSRTHQIIGEIDELRGAMASLESSQRGYLLLHDERLLDSRVRNKEIVQDSLASLRALTPTDPVQQQFLIRTADIIQQRLDFGDLNIATLRQEGFPAAQRQLATGIGITLTARINELLDQMRGREVTLLAVREQQTEQISSTTYLLMPVGVLLSVATLAVALFFLNAGHAEQERAESDLQASHKEILDLRHAMDQHAIVAITDPQGRITFVNDKFCAISNYSRGELLGQDHRIINSGHHSKEFFRDLWQTISHGRVWHGEVCNRAKDGVIYWVDTTIVPFLNPDGKPRQYVAIRTDITERKKAEEATARLAAIVDSSNDAIIGKDLHSIVTSWNAGAEELSGYTAEEMIGQPITRLLPPDRLHEETELISQIRRGESVPNLETIRIARDGRPLELSMTVSPIRDKSGTIIGVSSVARDISARKRAEQEIRQLNTTLERRVAERTAELEAANKELEAFSYSVSHDLRAPLRAVDGFSQAVIEDFGALLPDEGKRELKTIRESAQRMGTLIDDLLAFARLSRVALNVQQVDMSRLVAKVLAQIDHLRKDRNLTITVDNLPTAQGTPSLLEHVWTNLLTNAIKYTRHREKALIHIGARPENGETVYFVRDNGAGFDMRYVHKLFGVFQRLHRTDEFEGTGVGLAIVQRIVHRHGGRVWAEATVNAGSTFHFTLGTHA